MRNLLEVVADLNADDVLNVRNDLYQVWKPWGRRSSSLASFALTDDSMECIAKFRECQISMDAHEYLPAPCFAKSELGRFAFKHKLNSVSPPSLPVECFDRPCREAVLRSQMTRVPKSLMKDPSLSNLSGCSTHVNQPFVFIVRQG